MNKTVLAWVAAVAFLASAAPENAAPENAATTLTVAAAANVRPALEELKAVWEKKSAIRITISYGASGILTRQIEQGAPFDLFLSADAGFVTALDAKGRIVHGSQAPYAIGSLVVVTAKGRPAIATLRDLSNPVFGRIAIANPETAPYGRAAMESLKSAGLEEELRPRRVVAETVRDALRYVETGDADAGFAAESEARESTLGKYPIPQELYSPIRQELGIVAGSARRREAEAFSAFLRSAEGREIWMRHGYRAP